MALINRACWLDSFQSHHAARSTSPKPCQNPRICLSSADQKLCLDPDLHSSQAIKHQCCLPRAICQMLFPPYETFSWGWAVLHEEVLHEGTSLMAAEEQHQRNIPVSFQLRVTGGFFHTLHEAHPKHGEKEWKGVKLHRAEVPFIYFFIFLKKKFCGSLSRWKREKK